MNDKTSQNQFKYMYGVLDRPIVFFIGLLFAGVAGNLIYELAHDLFKYKALWKAWGVEAITLGLLIVAAHLVNRWYYHPKLEREIWGLRQVLRPKREEGLSHSYRGIIWLLSPAERSIQIARYALAKHRLGLGNDAFGKGNLEVCWCIYGALDDDEVLAELEARLKELKNELETLGVRVPIESYPISVPDAQQTFDAVKDIYEHKIRDFGLSPEEVIADITGGYASMSAGMMVGCHSLGVPVEYIQVPHFSQGGRMVVNPDQETWNHLLIRPDVSDSETAA